MKTRFEHRRHGVTGTTEHSFSDPQDPFRLSFHELIPWGAFIKSVKITYSIQPEIKEVEVEK